MEGTSSGKQCPSLANGQTLTLRCVRLTCQPTSQQYCYLILNQHQPPATSQSAVLFSYNKSAPAINHSQAKTAGADLVCDLSLLQHLNMIQNIEQPH